MCKKSTETSFKCFVDGQTHFLPVGEPEVVVKQGNAILYSGSKHVPLHKVQLFAIKFCFTFTSIGYFQVALASVSKQVLAQNFSDGKEFDLHEIENIFSYEWFGTRLVDITQRKKLPHKWPLVARVDNVFIWKAL